MSQPQTLRSILNHSPVPLKFGTSGRRGLLADLSQLEVYLNALAELEYLQSLPPSEGGIGRGEEFYFAADLRPSSTNIVAGRGGLAPAIARAIADSGMKPVYLGRIPTPALAAYAYARGKGSMMVTGSHIPFDRNGYKTNTAHGELLKRDEAPIQQRSEAVRARLYAQSAADSPFDAAGMLRENSAAVPPVNSAASEEYLRRYTEFFAGQSLRGLRLLVYEHSAVGRDLLGELFRRCGAEVIPAGRSETFVPIDTEAMDAAQLGHIGQLAAAAWREHGPFDAVVSTDGDSDRPLLLAVEPTGDAAAPCRVRFFGGDLVGMVVAEFLQADAVVVPVSCNDAVDRGVLRERVQPKTRIGSPFVIAGMEAAKAQGRHRVCGWEANGGFLLGSDLEQAGRRLAALPTRDAFLPLLAVLLRARAENCSVAALFERLPRRFSRAALLKNFPRAVSLRIVARLSPAAAGGQGGEWSAIRAELEKYFTPARGFGSIERADYTDGVRIFFSNGDVAHLRPSGNADELRIYAVADTQARADAITELGVAEPDGILRELEAAVVADARREAVAEFRRRPRPVLLHGAVQHYEWGGHDFIPALLGLAKPSVRPCAEYWLGSHPGAPAVARLGETLVPLPQLLAEAGAEILGADAARQWGGQLPYLLKVLDARQMLSIQAHPTLAQAAAGFDREEAAGVPRSAAQRNYKDRNHKPEVHVALTEFWMLHGFRPLEEIAATLERVAEFRALFPDFRQRLQAAGGEATARAELLRELYERVMTLPQSEVNATLDPLLERLAAAPPTDKRQADFWAARAAREFARADGGRDRGIFSIYLLHLLHLQPGEATYQPAGTLHAYLEGANVELMANSDNVLRGGLTPKHVDVPELLRILNFDSGLPPVAAGVSRAGTERVYPTPAREFELSQIKLDAPSATHNVAGAGPQILIVLEGAVSAHAGSESINLPRGAALLVPHGCACRLENQATASRLFKSALPVAGK